MNKQELLQQGGIDYAGGLRRFMGDAELYELVLRELLTDSVYPRARQAYAAGDAAGLLAAVHELKGASGNMDMTRLYQASSQLVSLLRQPQYQPRELEQAMEQLSRAYSQAQAAIEQALPA